VPELHCRYFRLSATWLFHEYLFVFCHRHISSHLVPLPVIHLPADVNTCASLYETWGDKIKFVLFSFFLAEYYFSKQTISYFFVFVASVTQKTPKKLVYLLRTHHINIVYTVHVNFLLEMEEPVDLVFTLSG
jgi:hypothetical protein